jgi:hypothetical protein
MKKNVGLTGLWPGVAVTIVATVVAAAEWHLGQSLCGREFCYPLFASSSPLWTVVFAIAFKVFGVREWIPLLLSYIFAFGSVILAFRLWNRAGLRRGHVALAGLALVKVVLCVMDECDAAPFDEYLREKGSYLPPGCHPEFLSDEQ